MRVRFLHSSDWQIGVTRRFLGADSQALWGAARIEAVRTLGKLAKDESCEFVVVAGDVWETNAIDRRHVLRVCEAMAASGVTWYLLPGNHDPLDASSIFLSPTWKARKPVNVHVFSKPGEIFQVRPGVEVVGAPWISKRPVRDLVAEVATTLTPAPAAVRILVAHGCADTLSPTKDNPALINVEAAEHAIRQHLFHYLALGDRHSFTKVGESGRIYYSSTPEVYDFDEIDPGKALIVDIDKSSVLVTPKQIGTWHFRVHSAELSTIEDVEALGRSIEALDAKDRTILKLALLGTLPLRANARLEQIESHASELLAAVVRSSSRSNLVVVPDNDDFSTLQLSGFASAACSRLRDLAQTTGPESVTASDALGLLVRLSGNVT